jgi:microcystin-dependent protein
MPASRVGYVYDTTAADYIPFTGPPAALPSGMVTMTAANTAPLGWMICNGSAVSRTTYADLFTAIGTTYGTGDGTTTFNLPDLRGRVATGSDSSQTEFDFLGETGGTKQVTLTAAQSGLPAHGHAGSTGSAGNDDTDHSHSATTGTVSSDHSHASGIRNAAEEASSKLLAGGSGTAGIFLNRPVVTGGSIGTGGISANHTHSVGTGGRSAFHSHPITVTVASTTAAAASSAHTNLQPYIVLNYIIKT